MDITPFLATFGLTAIAEFGDKTQLSVVALSARYNRITVFAGTVLAFAIVTGLSVLLGELLLQFLKPALTNIIAGVLFIIFGIWILLSKEDGDTNNPLSGTLYLDIRHDINCRDW